MQVSTDLPQMWTTTVLSVADITKTARRSNHAFEMLKLILSRTAEKGLHVIIGAAQVPPKRSRISFDLLRSTCHRWTSLELLGRVRKADWMGDKYAGIAMYPEKGHLQGFASLESVTIESMATYEYRRKLLTALERAPKLRSINMRGLADTQKRGDPPPAFNGSLLSHFEIECFPSDWYIRGLSMCSNIQSLYINGFAGRALNFDAVVQLDKLRKLKVSFSSKSRKQWNVSPNICHILRLPGLEDGKVLSNTTQINLNQRGVSEGYHSFEAASPNARGYTPHAEGLSLPSPPGAYHVERASFKAQSFKIGVSVAQAYSLMSATGRVVSKLMKSKEGTGVLKSVDVVDKDITTKIQVELGRTSRIQILYRSKEILSRLQAQEPRNERDSEEAQCTVEIKMFADL
ncbi:hypothetical protein AAF712_015775 [Marasmius tenuissimus]|uniref:Uncharacterized protein n=1 Tax=Marasmius tenuissimus TaxID=585030 RepID=A0ABR2Z8K9_9AGAR